MRTALDEQQKSKAKARQDREKMIRTNLAKLPQMKKEFWDSYVKLGREIEAERAQKDKVIEEIRESLGYDVDTSDPRFQEALAIKQGVAVPARKK